MILLLLNMLAQVTVVSLIALVLIWTLARHSPAARYGIALCAVLCIVGTPAIACGVDRSALAVPAQGPVSASLNAVLLTLWCLGAAALAWRYLSGIGWLGRLRGSARALDLSERAVVLEEVRAALGAHRLPAVAESELVKSPVALGPVRPMVLLPVGLASSLGDAALRDVLIHECAHLVQRHHLAAAAHTLALLLFWPHPLVHLLGRELVRAREELCDNFVLRCTDAPGYARTLLAVAERPASAPPSVAPTGLRFAPARKHGLVRRVEGLLDRKRERRTQWSRWKLALAASFVLSAATSVSAMRVTEAATQHGGETRRLKSRQQLHEVGLRRLHEHEAGVSGRSE